MVRQRPLSRNAIRARLMERGLTLAKVARDAGLHESACRAALYRPTCPAGEAALANALGMTVWTLFPDRFDDNGIRLTDLELTPLKKTGAAA